jgi:predicted amidohydrolase YtcJ
MTAPNPGVANLLVRGAFLPDRARMGADGEGRVEPGRRVDLRISGGYIVEVELALDPLPGEELLDASTTVVIPGLHDHHLHLRSLVASRRSVAVGPAEVSGPAGLAAVLAGAEPDRHGWRRAVGYHESVAGDLDRWSLDALAPGAPVRVQHRTGAMWVVSSSGVDALGLVVLDLPGIERDEQGRPTGRLFRMDEWLGRVLRQSDSLDGLQAASRQLAEFGVTGVTDATPNVDVQSATELIDAVSTEQLHQRLHLMCPSGVELQGHAQVTRGPYKFLLDDESLPVLEEFAEEIRAAHAAMSPVAVHCVTALQLVFTVSALRIAGAVPGDRIEHGSVVPQTLIGALAGLGVTVVTNPGFLRARGDAYLEFVEDRDLGSLYPCASLLAAGIPMAGGTDAPYGPTDPWISVWSACERLTAGGRSIAPGEAIALDRAIRLFTGEPADPGRSRRIAVGQPGDLCLLADGIVPRPGQSSSVVATVVAGRVVHRSE